MAEPDDDETLHFDSKPDQSTEFGFLQPSDKPGSLGKLAHYEIQQVLGRGGFGVVFQAFDTKLQRAVAIKVIAPALASTSPARKRFLREARAAAAVRHSNVVQIYGVHEEPLPYLVMELIKGQTLQQRSDALGPMSLEELLCIGGQIASGLNAAHKKELLHRDIKPDNILIEAGNDLKIKITDFGLARTVDEASLTRTGSIAGTPMYMSPEQASEQAVDHRADLFSLGSVLYMMATGRPPFRAPTTLAVLRRVAEDTPRPIAEIIPETPAWLCALIAKLHAKSPADRFQSAEHVAQLLANCLEQLRENGQVTAADQLLLETQLRTKSADLPQSSRSQRSSGPSYYAKAIALCSALLAVVMLVAWLAYPTLSNYLGNLGALQTSKSGSIPAAAADGPLRVGAISHDAKGAKGPSVKFEAKSSVTLVQDPNLGTGSLVRLTQASGGLSADTNYFVANNGGGSYSFYTSRFNSLSAIDPILLTSQLSSNIYVPHVPAFGVSDNAIYFDYCGSGQSVRVSVSGGGLDSTKVYFVRPLGSGAISLYNSEEQALNRKSTAGRVDLTSSIVARIVKLAPDGTEALELLKPISTNTANDSISFDPGYETGTCVQVSWDTGGFASGDYVLKAGVDYYLRKNEFAKYRFYPTQKDALDDTNVLKLTGEVARAGIFVSDPSKRQTISLVRPATAIAPFDSASAVGFQEAWSRYLNLPVNFENNIGVQFRLIPPGSFMMGSTQVDVDKALEERAGADWTAGFKSEMPQHLVRLSQPIYISAHEVTQQEHMRVMGENPSTYAFGAKNEDGKVNYDSNQPVETVSWLDVIRFCNELSAYENRAPHYAINGNEVSIVREGGYRLPTEAEWEFACRAGTTTRFWTGDADESADRASWTARQGKNFPQPVGLADANPFGLHDTIGNVLEWVEDSWQPDYYSVFVDTPAIDPHNRTDATNYRIAKGGCFDNPPNRCRSAVRRQRLRSNKNGNIGYRIALVIEDERLLPPTATEAPVRHE